MKILSNVDILPTLCYFLFMYSELIRVITFGIIGVWNTLFDLGLFISFLNTAGKLSIWQNSRIKAATVGHVFSFLTANLVSFVLNSTFTFAGAPSRGFWPYFFVTVFALIVSTAFIQYFNKPSLEIWFEKNILARVLIIKNLIAKFKLTEKYFPIVLKLASVFISLFVNYVGYKYFVFSK
jgi:putative flippase GtrA